MRKTAKLFKNGRSHAVRLHLAFRLSSREVYIHKDPGTGDVILSRRPGSWDDLLALADSVDFPRDFLASRNRRPPKRRRLFSCLVPSPLLGATPSPLFAFNFQLSTFNLLPLASHQSRVTTHKPPGTSRAS
jgi:antitoxin VapB